MGQRYPPYPAYLQQEGRRQWFAYRKQGCNSGWQAVETECRIGFKTLRQIASDRGVTHGAINKRAKKEGWPRDLSAKVSSKADELVSKALVSKMVSKETVVSERNIVEANAKVCANVVLAQHSDLAESAELERKLMAELLEMTDKADQFRQFGEMLAAPDEFGQDRINDSYYGAILNPQRVKSAKLLMDTKVIVTKPNRKYAKTKYAKKYARKALFRKRRSKAVLSIRF